MFLHVANDTTIFRLRLAVVKVGDWSCLSHHIVRLQLISLSHSRELSNHDDQSSAQKMQCCYPGILLFEDPYNFVSIDSPVFLLALSLI